MSVPRYRKERPDALPPRIPPDSPETGLGLLPVLSGHQRTRTHVHVYPEPMPNKTVYIKPDNVQLWADAEVLADRTGRSLSDLLAQGLQLVLDRDQRLRPKAQLPSPRPARPTVTSATLAPVPNPFAARD